jgi:crotonobetainyl-CoA:carnitine CoA-transferase CaiB-like acyl-CoA transferase
MRNWGHNLFRGRGLWWQSLARNKKSVSLDLRLAAGQAILKRLAAKSDVVIENFRPGVLEGWGLAPAQLHDVNPGLVIARVSGFGQTGPSADRAGFASVGEAMGGLRYINGHPGETPPRSGISLGDSLAAMSALQGVLMALVWRNGPGHGRGQIIDAAITEACFSLMEGALTEYATLGVVREPTGAGLKNVAPSNVYRSSDGVGLVIAATGERIFARLCAAIGQPALATDPRFHSHVARGDNAAALDAIIQRWASTKTADEIGAILGDHGVAYGPIQSIAAIHDDPQFRARGMIREMDDPALGRITVPGVTPQLSATPGALRWTGPDLGAHNDEIYRGLLGMSDAELAELAAAGAI